MWNVTKQVLKWLWKALVFVFRLWWRWMKWSFKLAFILLMLHKIIGR